MLDFFLPLLICKTELASFNTVFPVQKCHCNLPKLKLIAAICVLLFSTFERPHGPTNVHWVANTSNLIQSRLWLTFFGAPYFLHFFAIEQKHLDRQRTAHQHVYGHADRWFRPTGDHIHSVPIEREYHRPQFSPVRLYSPGCSFVTTLLFCLLSFRCPIFFLTDRGSGGSGTKSLIQTDRSWPFLHLFLHMQS